jgi:hypothetical protein
MTAPRGPSHRREGSDSIREPEAYAILLELAEANPEPAVLTGPVKRGSQTRSTISIKTSTCDTAPQIMAAVERDKAFCVSGASSTCAVLSKGMENSCKVMFVSNRLTYWILEREPSSFQYPPSPITKGQPPLARSIDDAQFPKPRNSGCDIVDAFMSSNFLSDRFKEERRILAEV